MIKLELNEKSMIRPGYTVKFTGRDEEVMKFGILMHLQQMITHTAQHDSHIFLTSQERNVLLETVTVEMERLGFSLERENKE